MVTPALVAKKKVRVEQTLQVECIPRDGLAKELA